MSLLISNRCGLTKPGARSRAFVSKYGLSRVAKLASNENPLGASPKAIEAMTRALGALNLYPNGGLDLREVLAREYDVKVDNVIAGSGSRRHHEQHHPRVPVRRRRGAHHRSRVHRIPGAGEIARREVSHRAVSPTGITICRRWPRQINQNTKIIYLANPNNPTGTIFTRHQFDEFYKHVPERVLIILDEAYFEYAKDNPRYPDSMHYRYDNVITLRTFSKIYGLAGVRIGYGFAHEELIRNLLKVKLPFEPSTPAQAAGIGALRDKEFLHRSLELNARGLRYLTEGLQEPGTDGGSVAGEFRDDGAGHGAGGRAASSRNCCRRGWSSVP